MTRRIFDFLTMLLFFAAIAAPAVDLWIRPDSARSPLVPELRAPAATPEPPDSAIALGRFPARYEAHFRDTFGLRDRLLRWNSIVKVFGFGVSPSSEVYFGKEGWLFYTGESSLENHRGAFPFAKAELANWARVLERKRALLASKGVRYLYVVAPDKETVYAELLPDHMRPIGPTRLEQFLASMKELAPAVEILDLGDALRAAKRDDATGDRVYGHLGTHWTGRGARVALRALLERLDRMVGGFAPEELDSFVRVALPDNGDSWTPRMYIGDLLPQATDEYRPSAIHATVRYEGAVRLGRIRKSEIAGSQRPRVILMHDSFGPHIEVGLSEQCSYLECRWDRSIDIADIEDAAPAVLVDMFVERTLNDLAPEPLLPEQDSKWSEEFDGSRRVLVALDKSRPDWGIGAVGGAQIGPAASTPRPRLPVTLKQATDRLALPALTPIEGEIPVLHVVIDAAFPTELVLFYRASGTGGFVRQFSYRKSLRRGTNDFHLPLDREGTRGELQLEPGDYAGGYLLRDLEIRSVRAQR